MPSIVPTSFRPRFVGGPNLGSGINASLIRKTQLVQFWLDQQYAGVTVRLVQGSPSGSSASGGTHLGPGDAADYQLVDSLGRSPSVNVWVAFSAMMRLLDCVSYVRGNDVNRDGRKDDTFDQHCHVIDREGGKVWQAALQVNQYLAHQNGLVGGHPDLEATVTSPLTLAAYTDAGFMLRYQSLSGTAFKLDVHTEPIQEDEHMSTFVQVKGDPTVYLTDGITARKIPDEKTLRDLYYLGALYGIKTLPQGTPDTILVATDVVVRVVGNPAVIGKVL